MGLSSNKTKTSQTSNQTTSGTTQPITPDWLTSGIQDYTQGVREFGATDPNQYVAGASPLQQQAWGNTDRLSGWQPQAATASAMAANAGASGANLAGNVQTPQVAQAPQQQQGKGPPRATETSGFLPAGGLLSPQGYSPAPSQPGYAQPRSGSPFGNPAITGASQAGAYSNPFDQQVIDTTLAGFDRNAGQQQAQLEAQGARNGAFGGSRFGIAQGQLGGDLAMNRAALEGGLRQQGFNTAQGYGMQDAAAGNTLNMFNAGQQDNAANRQLAAAGLLGDLSNSYDANTRADLSLMGDFGGQQRDIEAAYRASPISQMLTEGTLYGNIPYNALVGQQVNGTQSGTATGTTSQSPSLFNQLLSAGQIASMFYGGGGG